MHGERLLVHDVGYFQKAPALNLSVPSRAAIRVFLVWWFLVIFDR
jgi:hypothetical protein